jgi:hypothetical protein
VIHVGLGLGGMCVATGAQPWRSTVHLECSAEPRLVGAGGTLANLIFGGKRQTKTRLTDVSLHVQTSILKVETKAILGR